MTTTPPTLVFDASALVAWVLQTQGQWKKVAKLLDSGVPCVTTASALTETIYFARLRGNSTKPERLHQALVAQGIRVEPVTAADAEWAGGVIAESHANPAEVTGKDGQIRKVTLSLGDGLVLAAAQRLDGHAVTFDLAWWQFATLSSSFKLLNPWKVPAA